jgi:hypothetical protein
MHNQLIPDQAPATEYMPREANSSENRKKNFKACGVFH